MFDSVMFVCPDCGHIIEEQSKAGPCLLDVHSTQSVPLMIATSILNTDVYCEECHQNFIIASQDITPDTCVRMYLKTKKDDNETT